VRDFKILQQEAFDLLISGAGIFGACAAWEAALRGYKVALIEREDFSSGVSANSYKIIHGGIRYIQHLDIPRVRSSCHERSTLLRIAPHLVHPLPIAIPTYGYGMSGKPILAAGMYLYDLLTADRNRGITDPQRKIPWSRMMSRQEVLENFPGLKTKGLTGAVVFSDAQMYNPPRLVLGFVQSAISRGAVVNNHVSLEGYRRSGNRIEAARVKDQLSGETFEIRAKAYLNATGPWSDKLLDDDRDTADVLPGIYSRDTCFVVKRQFGHDLSVALMAQTKDPDAFLSRPARHVFVVPWRQYSLIGTWHKVVNPSPDDVGLDGSEIDAFIDEVRAAYPSLSISRDDVTMCNWGLVPFGEEQKDKTNLSYGKRSIVVDHATTGGPENLVSLVGIRYTMGRGDAAIAMRALARKLGDRQPTPATDEIPIHGGDVADIGKLIAQLTEMLPEHIDPSVAESLARNYGSVAPSLVSKSRPEHLRTLGSGHVLEAEVIHAVRNEMAMTLGDVVFRRTDLASGGMPDAAALDRCVELVAQELGLSAIDAERQREEVISRIPGWAA
jgi:glycerol-3-phosphate dehydrogenase